MQKDLASSSFNSNGHLLRKDIKYFETLVKNNVTLPVVKNIERSGFIQTYLYIVDVVHKVNMKVTFTGLIAGSKYILKKKA